MNLLKKSKRKVNKNKKGNNSQTIRFNLTNKVKKLEDELRGLQDRYNGIVKFNTELFMSINSLVESLVDKDIVSFEELFASKKKILEEIRNEKQDSSEET